MLAISASPTTIAEILAMAARVRAGEMHDLRSRRRVSSPTTRPTTMWPRKISTSSTRLDAEEDEGAVSKALTKRLEELKVGGAGQVRRHGGNFEKLMRQGATRRTATSRQAVQLKAQMSVSPARSCRSASRSRRSSRLCDILRSQVDEVRRYERELRKIVVDKCGMPQRALHQDLPAQRAQPQVGREGDRRRQALQRDPGSATCRRSRSCSRS